MITPPGPPHRVHITPSTNLGARMMLLDIVPGTCGPGHAPRATMHESRQTVFLPLVCSPKMHDKELQPAPLFVPPDRFAGTPLSPSTPCTSMSWCLCVRVKYRFFLRMYPNCVVYAEASFRPRYILGGTSCVPLRTSCYRPPVGQVSGPGSFLVLMME